MIVLLALAMGLRSSMVKKLGISDMLTTLLTFTMTGILSDLSSARGKSPHILRRALEVVLLFLGAIVGGLLLLKVDFTASILLGAACMFSLAAYAYYYHSRAGHHVRQRSMPRH